MVRVALVGCGAAHNIHCRNLSEIDDVKIVGHCDCDADRAKAGADKFGGDPFADPSTMYERSRPDAVFICVPPNQHGTIEEEAVERGLHLYVESPIALSRRTAKAISAAVRKKKVVAAAGYTLRYLDTAYRARQLLRGKAVSLVNANVISGLPDKEWWPRMAESGGQVVEQGAHLIDLVRYLCGDIAEVYATGSTGCMTKLPGYDIHDSSVVALRLKSGAAGALTSTCVSVNGTLATLEIVSPEATVRIMGDGRLKISEGNCLTEYKPEIDPGFAACAAFIDSIASGKKNKLRATYADAVKTSLVTLAANESIRSGLPVKP